MVKPPGSVGRAFLLLELLARSSEGASLSALARAIDAPTSTTHQLLKALLAPQLAVQKNGSKRYYIGPAAYGIAERILQGPTITSVARGHLRRFAEESGEDIYLAVSTADHVVYVDKVEGHQSIRLAIALGVPRSLHASAAGKVFLAARSDAERASYVARGPLERYTHSTVIDSECLLRQLDQVRSSGYAVSDGESIEGVMAIAAPIFRGREPAATLVV